MWFSNLIILLCLSLNSFSAALPAGSNDNLDQLTESLKGYQCRESDPNIRDCLVKSLQHGISQLKTGVAELGLPILDPIEIKKTHFNFDNNLIKGKIQLKDVNINGLSGVKVASVDMKRNGNALNLIVEGTVPALHVIGNHRADVFFNNAKISSKGTFDLTLSDVTFKITLDDELYEENGHTYVRTNHINIEPKVGDMKLQANGIFEDQALNDAIVEFINKNWRDFYKVLIEETHASWESAILKSANNVHTKVPFDLLIVKD